MSRPSLLVVPASTLPTARLSFAQNKALIAELQLVGPKPQGL
jgi:hypothetical protein